MKLSILDVDEFVKLNHLKEVTSPVLFQRGNVPHPEGLISNEIFGITTKSRKNTYAYIDLHGHFLQPHAYKVIKSLFMGLDGIINGSEYYKVENGKLVKDLSGDTGIEWLYNNWNNIKWDAGDKSTGMRKERVDLLKKTKRDMIFMTKQIVIPAFYRDITLSSGGGGETSELNNMYSNIIRYSSVIKDQGMFAFSFHSSNFSVQNNINAIYEYFKVKLEKKQGMLRKYLMGKSVDNAVRSVITAPNFHSNDPNDSMVSFTHCGVPISQACSLFYPFVVSWVKNFFDREFIQNKYTKQVWNPETDEVTDILELDNPETYFNDKYVKKMIDNYIKNPESRFDPIELPVAGGKKRYVALHGKRLHGDSKADLSATYSRKMTVTDLLFMACEDVCSDKHILVTRYPLLDAFGVFFNKIHISSTTKTEVVVINDKMYKWYPVIDFECSKNEILTKFVDSITFSNSFLKGLDGDYDGDQVTVKGVWTQEANDELDKAMKSKSFFLNITGRTVRTFEIEPVQTFYTMTKNPNKTSKELIGPDLDWLLSKSSEEFTFDILVGMLANLADDSERKLKGIPKFNCMDTITVPADKSPTKQKLETTVGRYLFNYILFGRSGLFGVVPYINEPVTDKVYNKIETIISSALLNDEIDTDTMVKWINVRDWLGFQLHAVITTSFSPKIIKTPKEVENLKKEFMKKYKTEIENGDTRVSEMIEKELIKKSKEIFGDDYGMDLYDSGARGSINNNFKNMNLMRGAVKNTATGKYDIVTSSLMDGMEKIDIPSSANTILAGAYPKACGTAVSGYLAKEILAALQTEVLDEPGSDCGTKKSLDITITDYNKKDYLYRYIDVGGKLILLDNSNIDKYVNKQVKMRSPMMCIGEKICNHCAGDLYYKLGIRNAGLTASRVATTLTRLNMKKFHENLIINHKINLDDLLI